MRCRLCGCCPLCRAVLLFGAVVWHQSCCEGVLCICAAGVLLTVQLFCAVPAVLCCVLCGVATAEVKELEEKGELEDGDPLNNFFKKIYGGVRIGVSLVFAIALGGSNILLSHGNT